MNSNESVASTVIQYFFSCVVFYYIYFIYKKRKFLKFAWKNKGFFVPILPLVGNLYFVPIYVLIYGITVNAFSLIRIAKRYFGYPLNVWVGHSYYYLTNNPAEIKIILNHPQCYDKAEIYEPLKEVFNNSIVLVQYNKWRLQRKYLQKGFKPSILRQYVPTYYQQSSKLLEDIQLLKTNGEIFHLFAKLSFVNFFLTLAGLQQEDYRSDMDQIAHHLERSQELLKSRIICPFIPYKLWTTCFPAGRKLNYHLTKLHEMVGDLIKQKIIQNSVIPAASVNTKSKVAVLDLVIRNDLKNMSEDDMFQEITLLTSAAVETTGNALGFCLTLLGMHSTIQETLYKEVMDQVGLNEIINDDLPNLKYTEAVILESLRLVPPVPFIARRVNSDIDIGAKIIPKGSNVGIDIFHLHRDEKYWPDPIKFDPTRFLNENALTNKSYTFLPFAEGRRDCIGKANALAMMKVTVANVIRKYKIISKHKSVDEFVLTSTVTMQPKEPLDCHFIRRLEE